MTAFCGLLLFAGPQIFASAFPRSNIPFRLPFTRNLRSRRASGLPLTPFKPLYRRLRHYPPEPLFRFPPDPAQPSELIIYPTTH